MRLGLKNKSTENCSEGKTVYQIGTLTTKPNIATRMNLELSSMLFNTDSGRYYLFDSVEILN